MDNKLVIDRYCGSWRWQVFTVGDVLLCSGSAADMITAAHSAIEWLDGTGGLL